jgi:WD40 repeat protein
MFLSVIATLLGIITTTSGFYTTFRSWREGKNQNKSSIYLGSQIVWRLRHSRWRNKRRWILFSSITFFLLLISLVGILVMPILLPHLTLNPSNDTLDDSIIRVVRWAPKGSLLAYGDSNGKVLVWDVPTKRTLFTSQRQFVEVSRIVWSPDAKYIAIAYMDGIVQVLNISSTRYILTYKGHGGGVSAMSWSPNGKYIISAEEDGVVRIWQFNTGKEQNDYKGHSDSVQSIVWSPDGKYIASAEDDKIWLWDVSTGKNIWFYQSSGVQTLVWSPDGKYIASAGGDVTVQVWNTIPGHFSSIPRIYSQHKELVKDIAWLPNGKYIVSVSDDGTIQIWDPSNANDIVSPYHDSFLYRDGASFILTSVTCSPDNSSIAFIHEEFYLSGCTISRVRIVNLII